MNFDDLLEQAKGHLAGGHHFPYDATDAWWQSTDPETIPPIDWAHMAARGIMHNLGARCGIDHVLEDLDEELRTEIVSEISAIIRAAAEIGKAMP